jgi:hypothetical protein
MAGPERRGRSSASSSPYERRQVEMRWAAALLGALAVRQRGARQQTWRQRRRRGSRAQRPPAGDQLGAMPRTPSTRDQLAKRVDHV